MCLRRTEVSDDLGLTKETRQAEGAQCKTGAQGEPTGQETPASAVVKLGHDPCGGRTTLSQGSHIRHPAYQVFTL